MSSTAAAAGRLRGWWPSAYVEQHRAARGRGWGAGAVGCRGAARPPPPPPPPSWWECEEGSEGGEGLVEELRGGGLGEFDERLVCAAHDRVPGEGWGRGLGEGGGEGAARCGRARGPVAERRGGTSPSASSRLGAGGWAERFVGVQQARACGGGSRQRAAGVRADGLGVEATTLKKLIWCSGARWACLRGSCSYPVNERHEAVGPAARTAARTPNPLRLAAPRRRRRSGLVEEGMHPSDALLRGRRHPSTPAARAEPPLPTSRCAGAPRARPPRSRRGARAAAVPATRPARINAVRRAAAIDSLRASLAAGVGVVAMSATRLCTCGSEQTMAAELVC